MFGSAILEVAIGLIFIYLLVSVACSSIREGVEALLKTRAAYLEKGIRQLLNDVEAQGLAKSLYDHPFIDGLFAGDYKPVVSGKRWQLFGANLPSYIPASNFALALMDLAARGASTDVVSSDPNGPVLSFDTVRTNVANLKNQAVQRVVLAALDAAEGDLTRAQVNLENWYDSAMDRVSGWYKRSTQWIIFAVGLFLAVGLNVNTIAIADYLFQNDAERAAVVAMAGNTETNAAISSGRFDEVRNRLDAMALPIGWSKSPLENTNVVVVVFGWMLTALAAAMGAPFWFDLLNKVMVIRSTVKPHEKSPEEGSEDRQSAAQSAVAATAATAAVPSLTPPLRRIASTPRDDESSLDGCDIAVTSGTPDETLPAARGGIA